MATWFTADTHFGHAGARALYRRPFPEQVPLTSIYSKGDGVVRWRACVVPYARCVEVTGSHIGLAFNRHAYREIATTLAPTA